MGLWPREVIKTGKLVTKTANFARWRALKRKPRAIDSLPNALNADEPRPRRRGADADGRRPHGRGVFRGGARHEPGTAERLPRPRCSGWRGDAGAPGDEWSVPR